MSPISVINDQINQYERWKDIVSEGNISNLNDMTFLEFMAKLDRTIEKAEQERKQTQQRLEQLKHKHR